MVTDNRAMSSWRQFTEEAPDLAGFVGARLRSAKHHVLASLRADGSPRVSGTEVDFWADHLTMGSMYGAVKARDLQRDPRFALHSNPGDGSMDAPDIKIGGRAVEGDAEVVAGYLGDRTDTPQPFHLFLLDIEEVVEVGLTDERDAMLIKLWRTGRPVREFRR
jgi:hypothetical protein